MDTKEKSSSEKTTPSPKRGMRKVTQMAPNSQGKLREYEIEVPVDASKAEIAGIVKAEMEKRK